MRISVCGAGPVDRGRRSGLNHRIRPHSWASRTMATNRVPLTMALQVSLGSMMREFDAQRADDPITETE